MLTQSELLISAQQVGETQIKLANLKRLIATKEQQVREMKLVARRDGLVIMPPQVAPTGRSGLPTLSGTALDPENLGGILQRQTIFCLIGDPKKMKARLAIDQSDVEFVKSGQPVALMLDERPGVRLDAKLDSIAQDPMTDIPRQLVQTTGGPLVTKMDPSGKEMTMFPTYEASVSLEHLDRESLMTGFRGKAKVRVGSASLGSRTWRYLKTIINFK